MKHNFILTRLISLLLIIGGAAGAGVSVWVLSKTSPTLSRETLESLVFAAIFLWAIWTGIGLWRNKLRAYKWAIALFAFQIPNFAIPAFSYQFYTGLLLLVSFAPPANVGLELHVASRLSYQVSSEVQDVLIGINLIAVAAIIWLIHVFPRRATQVGSN